MNNITVFISIKKVRIKFPIVPIIKSGSDQIKVRMTSETKLRSGDVMRTLDIWFNSRKVFMIPLLDSFGVKLKSLPTISH